MEGKKRGLSKVVETGPQLFGRQRREKGDEKRKKKSRKNGSWRMSDRGDVEGGR